LLEMILLEDDFVGGDFRRFFVGLEVICWKCCCGGHFVGNDFAGGDFVGGDFVGGDWR